MVFGERHRVTRGSEIDSGVTVWIDNDRDVGPGWGRGARGTVRHRCVHPMTVRVASLPPTKGNFVNRLWSRVGVRVASVGLLVFGVIGGVYLRSEEHTSEL